MGGSFLEKVLKLFANPFFSALVKVVTNSLTEQEVEFQWRRCFATLFFHNDFHESRKWGLKLIFLILSTGFLNANEQLCVTTIKARTTSHVSKCKSSEKKKNNFSPVPGENTKYALCLLLQKGKPPPKALNQVSPNCCFITSFAWTRTHKTLSMQSRGSTDLNKII